jgi:hypothetical protein
MFLFSEAFSLDKLCRKKKAQAEMAKIVETVTKEECDKTAQVLTKEKKE